MESTASGTYKPNNANPVNSYKMQDIANSSPEKCILHMYDLAIQACVKKESQKAGKIFASLIDALNFEVGGDIAQGLFRLYQYCIKSVHEEDYENPIKIIRELSETWRTALLQYKAA